MGSFNVACSASHISIDCGDPCLILPLKKPEYSCSLETSIIVTNDGPAAFFEPFCLPIRGCYDDYGNISEIQKSPTVKLLEEKVGDIEAWLGDVDDHMIGRHGAEKKPLFSPDAMMFIHGDIYDFMTLPDPENSVATVSFGTYHALEELGFVKRNKPLAKEDMVDPDSDLNRYKYLWEHPSSDKYFIASDGRKFLILAQKITLITLHSTEKYAVTNHGVYQLTELRDLWKSLTGFDLDIEKYFDIPISVYSVRTGLQEYQTLRQSQKSLGLFKEKSYRPKHGVPSFFFGSHTFKDNHLWDLYGPLLAGEIYQELLPDFCTELARFKTFRSKMYLVNKMLMPAMNGPQFGDPRAVRELATKVMEICFKKEVDHG